MSKFQTQTVAVATLHDLYARACRFAVDYANLDSCCIYTHDESRKALIPRACYGRTPEHRRLDHRKPRSPTAGIVAEALLAHAPITAHAKDKSFDPGFAQVSVQCAAPLGSRDQQLGVILFESERRNLSSESLRHLTALVEHVAAKCQEISRRNSLQQVEQKLQRSRSFIREILETAPNVHYVLDYDTKLMIEGADHFARMLGYTAKEVSELPEGVYSLIHPDDIASVSTQEAALKDHDDEAVVPVEFRLRSKDEGYRWFLVQSKVFKRDPSGEPTMEIGSVTDIDSLKQAQAELRHKEMRTRALFENCFDCIVLYDQFANCRYVAPSILRYTGYTDQEVTGSNALDYIVSEDHAEANRIWMDLLKRPGGRAVIEQRIRHKDGSHRWIEARLTNLVNDPNVHGIVSNFHDISERKQAEDRIFELANYDALTHLPNRRLLMRELRDALTHARKDDSGVVLFYVDLDRFKNVNDTLGHDVGDRLLTKVSAATSEAIGESGLLARLGGDEFAVLLRQTDLHEAIQVAGRIIHAMEQPHKVRGYEIRLSASIGIARFPDHGDGVDELFKHADIAMYRAKAHRNRFAVFEMEDARAMAARVGLEKDLENALANNEFVLYYQPRVDVQSGQIVAVEALIRWQCAERGLVMPDTFIPVAEETGLIYQIGSWVLDEAARQAAHWKEMGFPVRVAVNLSAKELLRPDIVDQLKTTLMRHGIRGNSIEVELTETSAMTDLEYTSEVMKQLRDLGVTIAIDDFGTGHSSLSYLRHLPVDYLKIDQSFLPHRRGDDSESLSEHTIMTGIVLLTESVGLKPVAEGVESEEQALFLQSIGCDEAQGYFYARPCPADEITRMLESTLEPASISRP